MAAAIGRHLPGPGRHPGGRAGPRARIYGHREVATRLGDASGLEVVTGGADVGGVARFHPIGIPPRSEQPIEIPAHRALVFGDAVVETGGGELRVWEDPLDSERRRRWWRERYLPTLELLAALEAGHVLVTHGRPVLGEGTAALRRALERGPWQRPKRDRRTLLRAEERKAAYCRHARPTSPHRHRHARPAGAGPVLGTGARLEDSVRARA